MENFPLSSFGCLSAYGNVSASMRVGTINNKPLHAFSPWVQCLPSSSYQQLSDWPSHWLQMPVVLLYLLFSLPGQYLECYLNTCSDAKG
jgi:hypothetical protein